MKKKLRLAVLMAMVMTMLVPLNAAVNDTLVIDSLKYEVTSEGGESGNCVKVVGLKSVPNNTTIELTIPETVINSGTTYKVTEIGAYAFQYKNMITSVTLPENCKSLADGAFFSCRILTTINLSKVESIGKSAFLGCNNLTSVDLSSCKSIGDEAFYGCKSLSSLDLSSCESIGDHAFEFCTGITGTITIPGSCIRIGEHAFEGCYDQQNLTHFKTLVINEGCEEIGKGAFINCQGLNSVTLPQSLKSIGDFAFMNCTFSEINIPKNVTTIGMLAFNGNGWLNHITVNSETPPTSNNTFWGQDVSGISLYFEGEALAGNYNTEPWTSMQKPYVSSDFTKDGMTFSFPSTLPENPEATLSSYTGEGNTLDIPATIRAHGYDFAVTFVKAEALSGKTEIKINSATPLTIIGSFTGSNEVTVRYPLGAREAYENSDWDGCNLRPYDFVAGTEAHVATVEVGGEVEGSVIVKIGGEVKGTVSKGSSKVFDVNGDIVISPAEGVEIASTTVKNSDGEEIHWEISGDDRTISQTVVTSDITANFSLNKMKLITVRPSSGGKIYVNDNNVTGTSFYVSTGTQLNVKAVANSGYGFSWMKIDGVQQAGATATVTANSDITIEASFYYIIPSVFMYDDVCYEKRWDANYWEEVTVRNLNYFYYDKHYTGDLELPEKVEYYGSYYKVTAINERAFSGSSELRSIVLPSVMNKIGSYAFEGCTGLEKLVVKSPSAATRAATTEPTVPTVDEHAFDDICETAVLYVPENWKEAFKEAPEWNKFFTVKEQREDGTVLAELTMTSTYGGTLSVGEIVSESDTRTVKVAEGSNVTVEVTPREGYMLTNLSYDGTDVMEQLVDGKLTLTGISGEKYITAVFGIDTGIGNSGASSQKVYVKDGRIVVDGVTAGEEIFIYNAAGQLLRSEVANGERLEIPMTAGQMYIVKIGKKIVKI